MTTNSDKTTTTDYETEHTNARGKSLIALTQEWREVEASLLNSGGELTEDIDRFFTSVSKNLAMKLDSYKYLLDRADAEGDFWTERAEECDRASQAWRSFKARLKDTIKAAMAMSKTDTLQGESTQFKLAASAASLEVTDHDAIPDEYFTTHTTRTFNRKAAIDALKASKEVPGLRLVEVKSLRITNRRPQ